MHPGTVAGVTAIAPGADDNYISRPFETNMPKHLVTL